MEFTVSQINVNTVEGKLLLVALKEICTTLHNKRTPDEVLKMLWELHKNNEGAGCSVKQSGGEALPHKNPFAKALNEQITVERQKQTAKLDEISRSANTVLLYAVPSMNPDDYCSLESLLVKLYRHHTNG